MTDQVGGRLRPSAESAARVGVSMMTMSAPLSCVVLRAMGSRAGSMELMTGSPLRRSPHLQAVACGSRSMSGDGLPLEEAATGGMWRAWSCRLPPYEDGYHVHWLILTGWQV